LPREEKGPVKLPFTLRETNPSILPKKGGPSLCENGPLVGAEKMDPSRRTKDKALKKWGVDRTHN